MLEVFLPSREESIAGGAEALPHGFLVATADGPDLFPFRLEALHLGRRLDPVGRVRQRLGTLAERLLRGQVRAALLVLCDQVRGRAREHFVLCRLEAAPHGLALRTRRECDLLPATLQLAHAPAGRVEVLFRLQRLHLLAQRLLDLEVCPALPLVRVTEFLYARAQPDARRLEARLDLLPILLRRQRRAVLQRRLDVAQSAIARLERQVLGAREGLDLPRNLLQPFDV